ncbi:MAG: hypothetical protein M1324_03605 [Patescibacteria group bacterium]|nr:hypothetical protein [Patescibacteria group bacterium]
MRKNIYKLIGLGFVLAMSGEFYDNFIVNHRPPIIIFGIIPSYLIFLLFAFYLFVHFKPNKLFFSFLAGLFGLIVIEDIILQHFGLAWPIQIFMFCYWFSIVSYPLILTSLKSAQLFLLPLFLSLAISLITFSISKNTYLSLAVLEVFFWIISAIRNGILLNKIH